MNWPFFWCLVSIPRVVVVRPDGAGLGAEEVLRAAGGGQVGVVARVLANFDGPFLTIFKNAI